MDSASDSSYKLQLAFAALVGASAAAASAYYLHCRAVAQLGGDLARSSSAAADGRQRRRPRAAGKPLPPRRAAAGSASLPDLSALHVAGRGAVGAAAARWYPVGEEDDEEEVLGVVGPHLNGALVAATSMQFPQGLPRLHVGPDGTTQLVRSSSNRRVGILRPNSPKSPVASTSAFESVEGSDEDDGTQHSGKLDNGYINTDGNPGGEHKGNVIVENGAATPLAAKNLTRSHSVSNDLHGVQPDPVAADILRKEPEQESFIKLLTAPNGIAFEYTEQCSKSFSRGEIVAFHRTRRRCILLT